MNSIIIVIGDELISGFRPDTNSHWLSKKLSKINIDILSIITVGDNKKEIVSILNSVLAKKVDYVFVTGGLGPTNDDVTLESFSEFLNSDSFFDKDYFNILENKFSINKIKMPKINKNQAMRIKGTNFIKNDIGTALGITFSKKNKEFFIYPGVPVEFKKMFIEGFFSKHINTRKNMKSAVLHTIGVESKLYEKLRDIIETNKNKIKFSFLPSYKGVTIKLISLSKEADIDGVKAIVIERLDKYFYGENDVSIEKVVTDLLIDKKLTISIAESCTGGAINNLISAIPGSSKYYNGGIVAYSNNSKQKLLKISSDKLKKYGAISKEISIDMANNISNIMNTDVAISTTGYSGPTGGDSSNINGTIYISVKFPDKVYYKKYIFNPDRDTHRLISTYTALNMLRLLLID